MPHQGGSGKGIVFEQPKLSSRFPYRRSDQFKSSAFYTETDDVRVEWDWKVRAAASGFVDEGGLLVTLGIASTFPGGVRPREGRRRAAVRNRVLCTGSARRQRVCCLGTR